MHKDMEILCDIIGTNVVKVPDSFTSLSQPCNVGIMKALKCRLRKACQVWKVAEKITHLVGRIFPNGYKTSGKKFPVK